MTTEAVTLPTEAFRARVKVQDAQGRIVRVGRVTVTHTDGALHLEGTIGVVRTGTLAEAVAIGQSAWVVLTTEGERWTVMAGGCGCSGR